MHYPDSSQIIIKKVCFVTFLHVIKIFKLFLFFKNIYKPAYNNVTIERSEDGLSYMMMSPPIYLYLCATLIVIPVLKLLNQISSVIYLNETKNVLTVLRNVLSEMKWNKIN